MKIVYYTDDGGELEVTLPTHKVVCSRCRGEGSVDHPAFSNGVSFEDDDDGEFREAYFNGAYDVVCPECHGLRVADEVEIEKFTPLQLKAWEQHCEIQSERAHEASMQARGIEF